MVQATPDRLTSYRIALLINVVRSSQASNSIAEKWSLCALSSTATTSSEFISCKQHSFISGMGRSLASISHGNGFGPVPASSSSAFRDTGKVDKIARRCLRLGSMSMSSSLPCLGRVSRFRSASNLSAMSDPIGLRHGRHAGSRRT